MLGFSRTFGYLLKALSLVPDPEGIPVRVSEIARSTGIPRPYLAKLVHMLGKAGTLQTIRGRRGGIRLNRPASEITLRELLELIEGSDVFGRCLLGLTSCDDTEACPSHDLWKTMRETIAQRLETVTLYDVRTYKRFNEAQILEQLAPLPPPQQSSPKQRRVRQAPRH